MDRAAPGDMTTDEAVVYVNERLLTPISKDKLYIVRAWRGIPVAEVGAQRLWFRRQDVDAFLAEVGTDPERWLED